ncbi:MAG TPA: hypothetical protein VNZ86_08610, partial [Bacteroidia bacterium]|nr:hypothetical protein [Bacteroidia bacterium]
SIASDVLLTLTSSVIFTVVWEQLCVRGMGLLPLFIFCIPVYLPTRLIFILQDFYSPNSNPHKRKAFFSSVLALLIPMLSAFAHTDKQISYVPKVVPDDFSASDTLMPYPNKKFNNWIFCKKENLSVAESDSFAHAFFRNGYFNPSSQKSAAIRKDSAGYRITITLPDNKARGNETLLAPYRKLRDELQELFPDQKIRIWIGGYSDGSNIIAKLE